MFPSIFPPNSAIFLQKQHFINDLLAIYQRPKGNTPTPYTQPYTQFPTHKQPSS